MLEVSTVHLVCNTQACTNFYSLQYVFVSLQKGRHIETITAVIDCENISIQRHNYWPGMLMLREVHVCVRIFTMLLVERA